MAYRYIKPLIWGDDSLFETIHQPLPIMASKTSLIQSTPQTKPVRSYKEKEVEKLLQRAITITARVAAILECKIKPPRLGSDLDQPVLTELPSGRVIQFRHDLLKGQFIVQGITPKMSFDFRVEKLLPLRCHIVDHDGDIAEKVAKQFIPYYEAWAEELESRLFEKQENELRLSGMKETLRQALGVGVRGDGKVTLNVLYKDEQVEVTTSVRGSGSTAKPIYTPIVYVEGPMELILEVIEFIKMGGAK